MLEACRRLFGASVDASFLQSLDRASLKKAYRRSVKAVHPDLQASQDRQDQERYARRFQEVQRCYGLLRDHLTAPRQTARITDRPPGVAQPPTPAPTTKPEPRVPPWRLRFGEFLYYSGRISWEDLIRNLTRQRRERIRLGEIAQRWDWLAEERIAKLLEDRQPGELVGEVLVRYQALTRFKLGSLLHFQATRNRRLGGYFVEDGLLGTAELTLHLQRQQSHNRNHA